jgi:hypothetical protein
MLSFGVMATIKEATQNAMAFALDALGPERAQGMRLEEVESAEEGDEHVWYITLSMLEPEVPAGSAASLSSILSPLLKREYKRFTIRKNTGEVTAMRIRELSNA